MTVHACNGTLYVPTSAGGCLLEAGCTTSSLSFMRWKAGSRGHGKRTITVSLFDSQHHVPAAMLTHVQGTWQ
jgi:hypothetical protein